MGRGEGWGSECVRVCGGGGEVLIYEEALTERGGKGKRKGGVGDGPLLLEGLPAR